MQFVLVVYHSTAALPGSPEWEAVSDADRKALAAEFAALNKLDTLTPAPPLGLPRDATTVRVPNGNPVTTPGPYLGVAGAVGGFGVLEAEDLDAAIAVATRVPQARRGGAVEIRPSARYW